MEAIENATIAQTVAAADISAKVAVSADTASPSNDKIQNAKADKSKGETPLPGSCSGSYAGKYNQ